VYHSTFYGRRQETHSFSIPAAQVQGPVLRKSCKWRVSTTQKKQKSGEPGDQKDRLDSKKLLEKGEGITRNLTRKRKSSGVGYEWLGGGGVFT